MMHSDRVKHLALEVGFDRVGIAPATESDGFARLGEWLDRGFAGDMAYMHRHRDARRHPAAVLPNVRSVVMTSLNYRQAEAAPAFGKIAQYARGPDYHDVLREKLNRLLAAIQAEHPAVNGRGVVDTAPLLERDFARRAGLGWFGKNTMLIHPRLGSFTFLGALLLDVELSPDAPFAKDHCGTCTRCLDACPTGAFPAPGWLDSRKCISYLTIENRGPIDEELRTHLEGWIFGCDICQDVCPWNRKAPISRPDGEWISPDLIDLLNLSDEAFRQRFRGTALFRTKRSGLVRNVAMILGNQGDPAALPHLRRLQDDPDEVVREAVRWAIVRIQEQTKDEPQRHEDVHKGSRRAIARFEGFQDEAGREA